MPGCTTLAEFAKAADREVEAMRTTLFLRIASVLTFIHAVLHTIGGVFGKRGSGCMQPVVTAMQGNEFLAMGVMRTFWDFYMGLGLVASVSLTVEARCLLAARIAGEERCVAAAADSCDVSGWLSVYLRGLVPVLLCGAGDYGDIDCALSWAGDCRCEAVAAERVVEGRRLQLRQVRLRATGRVVLLCFSASFAACLASAAASFAAALACAARLTCGLLRSVA